MFPAGQCDAPNAPGFEIYQDVNSGGDQPTSGESTAHPSGSVSRSNATALDIWAVGGGGKEAPSVSRVMEIPL